MELLIICIAPVMVAFMVALHTHAQPERKALALLGVVFMSMCAAVTCSVHFAVLVLSREPAFSAAPWAHLVFAFTWPSLAYSLDILAWDVFIALAALFAALSVQGEGPIRWLFGASAALAFFGLLGVPSANMSLRNVGILGYAVVFPIATALSAVALYRAGDQGAA